MKTEPMTSSLPVYAVPNVKPGGGNPADPRSVYYWASQLVTCAPVAAVVDGIPAVLTTVEEAWPGHRLTITRAELCAQVGVGTGDGLDWVLSFADAVGYLIQPYQSYHESDPELLEEALAAQPDVESAYHYDTEDFRVRMTRMHRADEMIARWLDAIITAHRGFARHRGIDLPY
jgi:hypothetical protein